MMQTKIISLRKILFTLMKYMLLCLCVILMIFLYLTPSWAKSDTTSVVSDRHSSSYSIEDILEKIDFLRSEQFAEADLLYRLASIKRKQKSLPLTGHTEDIVILGIEYDLPVTEIATPSIKLNIDTDNFLSAADTIFSKLTNNTRRVQ